MDSSKYYVTSINNLQWMKRMNFCKSSRGTMVNMFGSNILVACIYRKNACRGSQTPPTEAMIQNQHALKTL